MTVQEILDDVKTRYRHIYTDEVVVEWLDKVHKRVYKLVPRDKTPIIITLDKSNSYALPVRLRRRWIKSVTMGIAGQKFNELTYRTREGTPGFDEYVLIEDTIVISENDDIDNLYVLMIYYDKVIPDDLTTADLGAVPDLAEEHHEILIVGLLEIIAASRKDVKMKNNYAADYQLLVADFVVESHDQDPEYPGTRDMMPRRARYHGGAMEWE